MKEFITIDGNLYQKVPFNNPNACPECGAEGLHGCVGKRNIPITPLNDSINPYLYRDMFKIKLGK